MEKTNTKHTIKKKHKYNVIRSAGKLFGLCEEETESLANKAGLSLHGDENFKDHLRSLIERSGCFSFDLYNNAQVSERMFQHIKKGAIPSKETLIALAVSMGCGIDIIQGLLKRAGYILSASLPNDVIILWILKNSTNNSNRRLQAINHVLYSFDLPLLMTREKKLKSQE